MNFQQYFAKCHNVDYGPYHVLSEVWSNIDQIFDNKILLSKFTNMVSDSQISDQLLIVHDKAQWHRICWKFIQKYVMI